VPFQVRHVAPGQVWQRYAFVRAYEAILPRGDPEAVLIVPIETLHALRIDCKRLRYTLEFFREVLPPAVEPLIAQVVQVQDHLGDLHDASVAIALVQDFIRRRERKARKSAGNPDLPGVHHFLEAKEQELAHLVCTFPALWQALSGPEFRERLAEVVSTV
jgi:CHAD domain-containing protein